MSRKPEEKTTRGENRKWRRAESNVATTAGKALTARSESYAGYQLVDSSRSGTKHLAAPAQPKVLKSLIDEIAGLKRQIARMEAKQKAFENAYNVTQSSLIIRPRQQPPEGMTAMEAIMGKMDIEESPEELLAMLKALD